jgi:hypothetical protein
MTITITITIKPSSHQAIKPSSHQAIKPQYACNDDEVHRHRETQQYYPTPAVQQHGFRADLCSTTNGFLSNGSALSRLEEFYADGVRLER